MRVVLVEELKLDLFCVVILLKRFMEFLVMMIFVFLDCVDSFVIRFLGMVYVLML